MSPPGPSLPSRLAVRPIQALTTGIAFFFVILILAPFLPSPGEKESPCLQSLKSLESALHQLPRPVSRIPASLLARTESIYIGKVLPLVHRWRDVDHCDSRSDAELKEILSLHARRMGLATRVHEQFQSERDAHCTQSLDLANLERLLSRSPESGPRIGIAALRERHALDQTNLEKRWKPLLADSKPSTSLAECPPAPPRPATAAAPTKADHGRKGALALTPLLTGSSELIPGAPSLTLVARRRGLEIKKEPQRAPNDIIDLRVRSPKSVHFSEDSRQLFVQALEGSRTLLLSQDGLEDQGDILHAFGRLTENLFPTLPPDKKRSFNHFHGKPVESELTHNGRFLWVPYYRRSFDTLSREASAMALIDTGTRKILRVLPTGPISKGVKASRDGRWLAVSHWGDNTVGLWDISGDDPSQFHLAARFAAAKPLKIDKISGDRDVNCGLCVRGLEFAADASRLWVTAMRGGFVAEFDLERLPTLPELASPVAIYRGLGQSPRDIELTRDGKTLITSCAKTGVISRIAVEKLLSPKNEPERTPARSADEPAAVLLQADSVRLSGGVRSIRISPDDRHIYAAINGTSRIGVVALGEKLEVAASIPTDPYPVGMDISPDGHWLAVTAQGKKGMGGDSLSIYRIRLPDAGPRLPSEPPPELMELLN